MCLTLAGIGGLAAVAAARDEQDCLLFNHSPSVPMGLYIRIHADPAVGDFVTVRARDVAPALAAARNYDRDGDRFIKRLAARQGDHVCVEGSNLAINHQVVASIPIPAPGLEIWHGCRPLASGEAFLLGDTGDSFDGRYWGPVDVGVIEGVWRPL